MTVIIGRIHWASAASGTALFGLRPEPRKEAGLGPAGSNLMTQNPTLTYGLACKLQSAPSGCTSYNPEV
jgi:hypothetical protein